MPTNTCKVCGNPFEARTSRARICAGRCYRAHESAANKLRHAAYSPIHQRAINLTQNAITRGELPKQPCEVCGKSPAEAHHDDYAKPLDVRWLCKSDHRKHHAQHGPGANV